MLSYSSAVLLLIVGMGVDCGDHAVREQYFCMVERHSEPIVSIFFSNLAVVGRSRRSPRWCVEYKRPVLHVELRILSNILFTSSQLRLISESLWVPICIQLRSKRGRTK